MEPSRPAVLRDRVVAACGSLGNVSSTTIMEVKNKPALYSILSGCVWAMIGYLVAYSVAPIRSSAAEIGQMFLGGVTRRAVHRSADWGDLSSIHESWTIGASCHRSGGSVRFCLAVPLCGRNRTIVHGVQRASAATGVEGARCRSGHGRAAGSDVTRATFLCCGHCRMPITYLSPEHGTQRMRSEIETCTISTRRPNSTLAANHVDPNAA